MQHCLPAPGIRSLIEEIGKAGGEEVKENNIGIRLTPGCQHSQKPALREETSSIIPRIRLWPENPVRNGTRYAVRAYRGKWKHFCCNNKETNRKDSDSRVSERALREIYLKAFEIIVKEADPYTIMSSYNLINGVPGI